MSELLKVQQAKEFWAKGQKLQLNCLDDNRGWEDITNAYTLGIFEMVRYQFRLKPVVVILNGMEVPAPFDGTNAMNNRVWILDLRKQLKYDWTHISHVTKEMLCWRTEADIAQVVTALEKVFIRPV